MLKGVREVGRAQGVDLLLVTAGKARVFDGKGFSGLQAVLATANGRGVWGRRALSPPP